MNGERETVNVRKDLVITRYYNGVPFPRTPISCMAAAFFVVIAGAGAASADVTFPLAAKWSAALPSPPAYPPAFDDNSVYISLQSQQLVSLKIADGSTAWSVECPMSAAPAAGGGFVYAGSDGLVEARGAAAGAAQWRRPVEGKVITLHWNAGWLFAQTEPGLLLAIRAADGEILWQTKFGATLSAPPAAAGDRVYLGLNDGRVLALALQSGEEIWNHKLAEPAAGILPVGDRVFVGSRDKFFYSFEMRNGSIDWRWPTGADLLGLPVLDERRVYFLALDNVLRAHDRNHGSMIWKQVLPVRPFTGPLLSGETLIVSGIAAELYGYNTRDGKRAGPFALKGAENEEMLLAAPPHLTTQDSLILVTKGGQVRAIGSSTAPPEAPAAPAPATPEAPPAAPGAGAAGAAPPTPTP